MRDRSDGFVTFFDERSEPVLRALSVAFRGVERADDDDIPEVGLDAP